MEKRFVYADNAATTPVTPAVLEAMTPWLMENYGNPSSIYSIGAPPVPPWKRPAARWPPP